VASTRPYPQQTSRPSDLIELTDAAMAIGLALVLGNMKLVELPAGGSISAGTVPLIALAIVRGPKIAFIAGLCAGLVHALFGGVIVHPAQLLLDYGIAYAGLAVAGLPGLRGRWYGIVAAAAVQLVTFTISGVLFFSPNMTSRLAWLLSLAYNATTVIPECLIALAMVPLIVRAYARLDPQLAAQHGMATVTPQRRRRVQASGERPHAPALAFRQESAPARAAIPRPGGSQQRAEPGPAQSSIRPDVPDHTQGQASRFRTQHLTTTSRLDSRQRPLFPDAVI